LVSYYLLSLNLNVYFPNIAQQGSIATKASHKEDITIVTVAFAFEDRLTFLEFNMISSYHLQHGRFAKSIIAHYNVQTVQKFNFERLNITMLFQ